MPEIKWGTADKVEKTPHVWKHADEPFWYVSVGIVSIVFTVIVIGLIWLAAIGIWWPLVAIGIVVFVVAAFFSVIFLLDYYDLL